MLVVRGRPGLGVPDQRLEEPELLGSRQRLARPVAPNQRATLRRSHDSLQAGSLVQRRQNSRGQLITPAGSPFQSSL